MPPIEEVIQAAKLANADTFIAHLRRGYRTQRSDDATSLSQGQRQLLSIARAIVANPPQEAAGSIDTLMRGRTVFIIAERQDHREGKP